MTPLLEVSHLDKQIGSLHLQDISFTLAPCTCRISLSHWNPAISSD